MRWRFTWSPQSLAVFRPRWTASVVAVSFTAVAGTAVLGVGVSGTRGRVAGAELGQVTVSFPWSAHRAYWFQLREWRETQMVMYQLLKP